MISRGAMHTVIVPEPAKSAVCTNIHCSTLFENVIQYTDKSLSQLMGGMQTQFLVND